MTFEDQKEKSAYHKKKYNIIRVFFSILNVVAETPLFFARLSSDDYVPSSGILPGINLILVSLEMITIAAFMAMALFKFAKIVKSMPFKADMNRLLIFFAILSTRGWAGGSIS